MIVVLSIVVGTIGVINFSAMRRMLLLRWQKLVESGEILQAGRIG